VTTAAAALDPAWASAFGEHEAAVNQFVACLRRVPPDAWNEPTAPGKWSPAGVALHIVRAYEFGHAALTRGTPMEMRLSPFQAWFLRTFIMPVVLVTDLFPSGADAPAEVAPDAGESASLLLDEAIVRVRSAAGLAAAAIADAARAQSSVYITHAYFGRLPGLTAFRFVSAHTRHHARALDRRFARS
jgi:hypothetical protein